MLYVSAVSACLFAVVAIIWTIRQAYKYEQSYKLNLKAISENIQAREGMQQTIDELRSALVAEKLKSPQQGTDGVVGYYPSPLYDCEHHTPQDHLAVTEEPPTASPWEAVPWESVPAEIQKQSSLNPNMSFWWWSR